MQSTGAAYMSTAGSMLTRDLYKRYLNPTASHDTQKLFGRLGVLFIVLSALLVATFSRDALVLLGGLAVAFGFQMWPALASVCWFPWLTRQGVTWGLAAGLIGVIFTENFGTSIAAFVGIDLPWGRWPWTMHSAGWGMFLNLAVCLPVSAMTQNEGDRAHRMIYHDFLREHASLPESKRGLVPIAECGRRGLDLRHPVDLGLADPVLDPGCRHDVVPGVQDGDVDHAGAGDRSAGGRHRRRRAGPGPRRWRRFVTVLPSGSTQKQPSGGRAAWPFPRFLVRIPMRFMARGVKPAMTPRRAMTMR
jgi:hypothetical protein